MTTGQLDIKLGADTSAFQAGFVRAAEVSDATLKRIARQVVAASDATKQLGATAQASASSTRAAYETIAAGADKAGHASAGFNRELIVLAHEMSQGNYSRFGGSMLVLAERSGKLEQIFSAAGLAVLGFGGAVVGAIAAVAVGAIDADKFGRALQLTGNYAAVTQSQIDALAASQSKLTGQSQGTARSSLEAAAGSGLFGPGAFAQVARAMTDYRRLSGSNADDALKIFERLKDGASKWAEEENRSFHFATLAQIEHLKKLEDTGHADQAAAEAVKLLADALEGRATPALGAFGRAWQTVKGLVTDGIAAIESIGRPVNATSEAIDRIDAQMKTLQAIQGRSADPSVATSIATLAEQRRILVTQQSGEAAQRAHQAETAALQQAGIAAHTYTDQVLQSAKAVSARNDELAKFAAAVKAQAAAGSPLSGADVKAGEAAIRKKYASGDPKIIAPPDTAQQAFRVAEIAQNESVIAALRADSLKTLVEQNDLMAHIHELDSAQQDFRRSELEAEEEVTKAMREQVIAQDKLNHEAAQRADFSAGAAKALQKFRQDAADSAAFGEKVFTDGVQGMTDALVQFAKTGHLSFKGLIDAMISDLIRLQAEKAVVGLFGEGGAFGGLLGSLFGSGGSANIVAAGTGGEFANGLDYVPYDNFPAYLHEGERVMTRQDAAAQRGAGGHSFTFHQNYSIGEGVSRADVSAAVAQGNAQTEARMRRLLKNGSVVTA